MRFGAVCYAGPSNIITTSTPGQKEIVHERLQHDDERVHGLKQWPMAQANGFSEFTHDLVRSGMIRCRKSSHSRPGGNAWAGDKATLHGWMSSLDAITTTLDNSERIEASLAS